MDAACYATSSDATVTACNSSSPTTPPTTNGYLGFIKQPFSEFNNEPQADNWQFNAVQGQFKQMYATYPTNYLLSVSHSPEVQYFYCGS